jgi:hypothetical protein
VGIIEKNWNSMVPQSVDNIVRHSMAPWLSHPGTRTQGPADFILEKQTKFHLSMPWLIKIMTNRSLINSITISVANQRQD